MGDTVKHIINEGTITFTGGNVKKITIASVPASTPTNENNPFTNGLVTEIALPYNENGEFVQDIFDNLSIDSSGNITIDNGIIPYTNITIKCIGA